MMLKLRQEDLEYREIEGEVVALDLRSSSYIGVNKTGGALWPLLQEGTDEAALVHHLIDTFGIAESVAQQDVRSFVDDLRTRGLLTETD